VGCAGRDYLWGSLAIAASKSSQLAAATLAAAARMASMKAGTILPISREIEGMVDVAAPEGRRRGTADGVNLRRPDRTLRLPAPLLRLRLR